MSAGKDNKSERGAVLVEFALIAPILLMLILAMVQFGLLLNQVQGLHAAAREGARTASVSGTTNTDIENSVNSAMSGVSSNALIITITPAGTGSTSSPCETREGLEVVILVETQYALDIPFLTGETIDIEGKGTFRCEA